MAVSAFLPYLPFVVCAAAGLGLLASSRGSRPRLVLRLAAAFFAMWALLATTALVWFLTHGRDLGGIGSLVADPLLLLEPRSLGLWEAGGIGAVFVLVVAFTINQVVARGYWRGLEPVALPWPKVLPSPGSSTTLARFRSDRREAFTFAMIERAPGAGFRWTRREVILVSSGLWEVLDAEERVAVVAHELGHVHALDSRYLTFLRTFSRLVRWDPVIALLAERLTRGEEFRADRVAAQITGRPGALARALTKAAETPNGRRFGPQISGLLRSGRWEERAVVRERIRRLLEMAERPVAEVG